MYDYTRLGTVVSLWLLGAVFCGMGWGLRYDVATLERWNVYWLVLILRLVGGVFVVWAFLVSMDWVAHHSAERMREWENARVVGVTNVAHALKGLTGSQMDFVERLAPVTMEMIVNEASPTFLVRVPGGHVPYEAVEDFLLLCKRTEPYLYPERDFNNWRQAQAITRLIVMQGWAEASRGPLPAKLVKPLDWVGERFGVDVGVLEELTTDGHG